MVGRILSEYFVWNCSEMVCVAGARDAALRLVTHAHTAKYCGWQAREQQARGGGDSWKRGAKNKENTSGSNKHYLLGRDDGKIDERPEEIYNTMSRRHTARTHSDVCQTQYWSKLILWGGLQQETVQLTSTQSLVEEFPIFPQPPNRGRRRTATKAPCHINTKTLS